MSRVPGIYAEWIPVLKEFAAGRDDEKTIPAMQQGRLHWCDIVAGRFASRLMAAFNARFDYIGERFRKAQDDGIPIEQALKQLDRDLDLLFQASQLQCLPEKEKQMLQDELQKTRQDMDDALEESARQDPSGELDVLLRRRNKGSR